MIFFSRAILISGLVLCAWTNAFPQLEPPVENLPADYLTPSFHAGRRQALRDLMPPNSVAVVFSYPPAVFSKDVDYVFHQNPDLYYFSGYNEPNAMLLIFKDMQGSGDSSYNELFFVQHRDVRSEQWTGRRLGVEGVKSLLRFKMVFNGESFDRFPIDLKNMTIISDDLPDTTGGHTAGSLAYLALSLVKKSSLHPEDKDLNSDLQRLYAFGRPANLAFIMGRMKSRLNREAYKNDSLIQELVAKPDSSTLKDIKRKYKAIQTGTIGFNNYTNALRGIKTPDEIALLKKAVEISGIAHIECMRAVKPQMSERELEGIMIYMHKKYGSEVEAYPPIVGAGANGCIMHYEENNLPEVKNQLVLMDVGAMYHGYSADVTRTFPANGKFTNEQKVIYQLVYNAQQAAFEICRPGISFDSVESRTTQILSDGLMKIGLIKEAKDVKKYYPHGMSHHIGLDVHDKGNYENLEENMVVTVEPGIYIPYGSPCDKKWWNIGVRIEDDVWIGKDGNTLLSAEVPRDWKDVEKTVAEKSIFDSAKFPAIR